MRFLTRIGQILAQATAIAAGFAPLIKQTAPGASAVIDTVSADLSQIANVIVTVEVMGQALQIKGPEKLRAAAPLVAQVLLQSSVLANHKIDNPTLFQQGASKIADGMADVLNSLNDHVDTQSKT
jgi:hypothetical protein